MTPPLSIHLAYVAAAIAAVLAVMLLVMAVFLRSLLVHRRNAGVKASTRWRGLILGATQRTGLLPSIRRSERMTVLITWNQMHESVRGSLQESLRDVARRAGLDGIALKLMTHGARPARLLGVTTVGNLGTKEAWNEVVSLTRSPSPVVASAAARALVRIDRNAAVSVLVPLLVERTDLHPARIGPVLVEAGEPLVAALACKIPSAHVPDQVRLIKLIAATKSPEAAPAVREALSNTTDAEVVAACLRALAEFRDPRDAWAVRRHLEHPASFVRVQAASALGKLGGRADEARLVDLLSDSEWWVRYRAAQALVSLPFLSSEHLLHMAHSHPDRFASDALRQALAEAGAR